MVKIFAQVPRPHRHRKADPLHSTGVTGYIGGDVLYALHAAHPEHEYTALVRRGPGAAQFAARYPSVRLVYCTLSSATKTMRAEAAAADVVVHCADADDARAARAIAAGLASRAAGGFYIHVSGARVLAWFDIARQLYGTDGRGSTKVYDDWEGITQLVRGMPEIAPHRKVEELVLNAGRREGGKVRTAIVCPPCVYGRGRGSGNTRSRQVPELARVTLERGEGVKVGEGKARWSGVHVADLADLFVKLVDEAAAGGGKATWGDTGYYFAEDGEFEWGQVSRWVLDEVAKLGLAKSDTIKSLTKDEANDIIEATPDGHILWGTNSRCRAIRARRLLQWKPTRHGLRDEVKDAVEVEARKLGKLPAGHAAIAAGDA